MADAPYPSPPPPPAPWPPPGGPGSPHGESAAIGTGPKGVSRGAEVVLSEIETLPTLPPLAMRLMRLGSQDDADLKEIIRLIELDPSLSAKVLSLCRRAELGLGDRIRTVERAVVLLGLDAVRSVVLSVQVFEMSDRLQRERTAQGGAASRGEAPEASFDRIAFWQHSIAVACSAELICREHRALKIDPSHAFTAGLMHDLGKLVLDIVLPKAYPRVVQLAEHRQGDIAQFEHEVLGLDHHTAGKRLAERWDLPEELHDVIWLHGQPVEALARTDHESLIGLVKVADALSRSLHLGWSGNFNLDTDLDELCVKVGLDPQRVQRLIPRLHEALAARSRDLGLSDESADAILLDAIVAANRQLARINGALQRRSRSCNEQSRIFEAIRQFHRAADPGLDAAATLTEVARSARGVLGDGLYVTLLQTRPDGPWRLCEHDRDGEPRAAHLVEPARSPGAASDELRAEPPESLDASLRVVRLVDGHVHGVASRPGLRVTPVLWSREAAAILLHDRDAAARQTGARQMEALAATWGAAIAGAVEREAATRLGEKLAQSNMDLVHAQRRLADVQSMARLGELTAGAAHELNNPLTVIRGRSQAMAHRTEDETIRRDAQTIAKAATRLSELIERLHLIARPPKPEFEGVSLVDLVGQVVRGAKERTSGEHARDAVIPIRVVVNGPLPPARLDRELMAQALVEVVVNAIEASPRGAIEVRVQTDALDDRLIMQVTDDGVGMSAHAMQHALDPFFSEKPAGRQPGLGLALAHSIIRLHDGEIRFANRRNGGTIVTVAIPHWRWEQHAEGRAA